MEHTKNSRKKQPTILGKKINRTKFRNDQILELSDNEFKITKNNMLNFLVENEDKMHEQMENFSREMEITVISQKEMLKLKNTIKEIKNVFSILISRLDTDEERTVNSKSIEIN